MQTQTAHLIATHNLCTSIPQFAPAVRLLRVWANQRGFGRGKRGSVRGWENMGSWWGWVIGWLVDGGEPLPVDGSLKEKSKKRMVRLGRGLSSYQLFRGTLDFLGTFTKALYSTPSPNVFVAIQLAAHHDFEREPVFMKTTDGGHKVSSSEAGLVSKLTVYACSSCLRYGSQPEDQSS
jgi:U3 small nucleolar RNA-associated protein 22